MNWDDYDTVDELPAPPRKTIPAADLELLTLAACALGAVRTEEVEGEGYLNLHMPDGSVVYAWNSLVHKDDAFNLQVDLSLHVAVGRRTIVVESADHIVTENRGDDARAAAARAVTRAAAEIGKTVA